MGREQINGHRYSTTDSAHSTFTPDAPSGPLPRIPFLAASGGFTPAPDASPVPTSAAPTRRPRLRLATFLTASAMVVGLMTLSISSLAQADTKPLPGNLAGAAQVAVTGKTIAPTPVTSTTSGAITASAPTWAVAVGTRAYVKGQLVGVPWRRTGYRIELQRVSGSSWARVTTANSYAAGSYTMPLPTSVAGQRWYRMAMLSTTGFSARYSRPFLIFTGVGSRSAYKLWDQRYRWNPCQTIGYRINFTGAPASAKADVQGAITRISAATGLTFVYKGSTSAIPFSSTYPRDTQLVIAYIAKGQSRYLPTTSRALAVGGPVSAWAKTTVNGKTWSKIATAGILLDRNIKLRSGFAATTAWPYVTWGGVILHEMGHVVGLDHVYSDKLAMMATPPSPHSSELSLGDYAGLKLVGRSAGCLP